MQTKNLAQKILAAFALLAAPLVVQAGDIYSIDFVTKTGSQYSNALYGSDFAGRPSEDNPLKVGDEIVIRVRMLNKNWSTPGAEESWDFYPTSKLGALSSDALRNSLYAPGLGFKIGANNAFARWVGTLELGTVDDPDDNAPTGCYTDLFFSYTVKAGDIAWPALLMAKGSNKAVSDDNNSTEYSLDKVGTTSYWTLQSSGSVPSTADFSYYTGTVPYSSQPSDPKSGTISGRGMGLYVNTIDFDAQWFDSTTTPKTWRQVDDSGTEGTGEPSVPTLVASAAPSTPVTVYVWVEGSTVAEPAGAYTFTDSYGTRRMAEIQFDAGDTAVPFEIIGKAVGATNICVSSTKEREADDAGAIVTSWISRQIKVVPSVPNVTFTLLGADNNPTTSLVCTSDYGDKVGTIQVRVSPAPSTGPLTVTVNPSEDVFGGTKPYLGISDTTSGEPWKNSTTTLTFNVGEAGPKNLYLYGLGSTAEYENPANSISFTPVISGPDAGTYVNLNGRSATLIRVTPSIVAPAEGDTLPNATLGENYPVTLTVSGGFNDMYKSDIGAWTVNYVVQKDEAPLVSGSVTNDTLTAATSEITATIPRGHIKKGANTLVLWVTSPDGKSSEKSKRTVNFKVYEPPKVIAVLESVDGITVGKYAEDSDGNTVAKVYFKVIDQDSYSDTDAVYAFLKPTDDSLDVATNKMSSKAFALTGITGSAGAVIPAGEAASANWAEVTLLDGPATAMFTVELCSTPAYASDKILASFENSVTIEVTNVVPKVESVLMGGRTAFNGTAFPASASIPLNIAQKFYVKSLVEPSAVDLENSFKTQWYFDDDPLGGEAGDGWHNVSGDPRTNAFPHAFSMSGTRTVKVRCQDKDMADKNPNLYTDEFTFTVVVDDKPAVVITPRYAADSYDETQTSESESAFDVSLIGAPVLTNSNDSLEVQLTVAKLDPAGDYSTNDIVLSTYSIKFANGIDGRSDKRHCFYFKTLDGTAGSLTDGFRITAKVVNAAVDAEGKTWSDGIQDVKIKNTKPKLLQPEEEVDAEGNVIVTPSTIGAIIEVPWAVDDVPGDKTNLTVICMADEKEVGRVVTSNGVYSGTFKASFSSAGESRVIKVSVYDKDDPSQTTAKLYYKIDPAKVLRTVAGGPSGANATIALSGTYERAAGRGEGHVFVSSRDGTFAEAEYFNLFWNCGTKTEATVYGYGYKFGDVDNGSLSGGNDVALTPAGGSPATAATGYYTYAPGHDCDSFFYGWLTANEPGGKDFKITVNPEVSGSLDYSKTYATIDLPQGKTDDDVNYVDTYAEAVFARELYPSDNMGDINGDGVPDYLATYYNKGGPLSDATAGGGAELLAVDEVNDDADYLPSEVQLKESTLIPGTGWENDGQPFAAAREIRGYHTGLNFGMFKANPLESRFGWVSDLDMSDAEKTALYNYAAADTEYTTEAGKVTASRDATTLAKWLVLPKNPTAAEYTTYTNEQAIAKAYIDKTWSKYVSGSSDNWGFTIENRTDPTVKDSDGDGIPDGYEYYYWYAATVGFPNVGQISGRKFNRNDFESPTPISSAEIAALFNPNLVPNVADFDWKKLDSDGDGLYDWEEMVIGTSPVDCDTDKDNLCDYYELRYNIDPLSAADGSNGNMNADGDFMARATMRGSYAIFVDPATGNRWAFDSYVGIDDGTDVTIVGNGFRVEKFKGGYIPNTEYVTSSMGALQTFVFTGATGTAESALAEALGVAIDLYHCQVYNYFGFDPRTGWYSNGNNGSLSTTSRWLEQGSPILTGTPINTASFTALDEFLLYKYRQIVGNPIRHDGSNSIQGEMLLNCTNPNTPFEERVWDDDVTAPGVEQHGADSDGDGVPDGWELYVCSDPKIDFRIPKGTPGHDTLYWDDGIWGNTSVVRLNLGDTQTYNGMTLVQEYAGTDTTLAYQACDTVYVNFPGTEGSVHYQWFNKFFPVDPRNPDTDGDGIGDSAEGSSWSEDSFQFNRWGQDGKRATFEGTSAKVAHYSIYGSPSDNGSRCIAGGGYNPLTVDTDGDGLPDPWERQYAGVLIENGSPVGVTAEITNTALYDDLRAALFAYGSLTNDTGHFVIMGMNGTVADAASNTSTSRDIDWDGDGLQNWQEYMVQALRHLRYDDSVTPLMGYDAPDFDKTTEEMALPGPWKGANGFLKVDYATAFEDDEMAVISNDLGYVVFADFVSTHPNYLRNLGYFAPPPRTWDHARVHLGYKYMLPPNSYYKAMTINTPTQKTQTFGTTTSNVWVFAGCDASNPVNLIYTSLGNTEVSRATDGSYVLKNYFDGTSTRSVRIEKVMVATTNINWAVKSSANKYVGTDPRHWDSDKDGMDDYWELFHGLNPILGSVGTVNTMTVTVNGVEVEQTTVSDANDIIADAYGSVSTWKNAWIGWNNEADPTTKIDPIKYPWMMGIGQADADGDGLRNEEEAIAADVLLPNATHTDPSPLWMTDSTVKPDYLPVIVTNKVAVLDEDDNPVWNRDPTTTAWIAATNTVVLTKSNLTIVKSPSYVAQFYDAPWYGAEGFTSGKAFAYEMNEGYDTDNDWRSDSRERARATEPKSDNLDPTDLQHRQSIYFGGPAAGSEGVAITFNPSTRPVYASNGEFFKQFTVEAWLYPEGPAPASEQYAVVRACNYGGWDLFNSNAVIRLNFALGIAADGSAFAELQGSTSNAVPARAVGQRLPTNEWSHVAATYDGASLVLYVNGSEVTTESTSVAPATGITGALQDAQTDNASYYPIVYYESVPTITMLGGRPNGAAAFGHAAAAAATSWSEIATDFFKGSIAEVRTWDGACTAGQIAANYKKRFSVEEIKAMRDEVFESYVNGGRRSGIVKNSAGEAQILPVELVQCYSFNSLPGATAPAYVQQTPPGFAGSVLAVVSATDTSLPDKVKVGWWNDIVTNTVIKPVAYTSGHVVPWIENVVAHLPLMTGSINDSVYWSTYFAGYTPAEFQELDQFTFPNTMNPYGVVFSHNAETYARIKYRKLEYNYGDEDGMKRWRWQFDVRRDMPGSTDLIPLGSAYAKRLDKSWDGQGAETAWAVTTSNSAGTPDADTDGDGIPDWAATTYTTAQAYARALAKGLLPTGTINPAYENTEDVDADGLRDWWEKFHDIYAEGPKDDHDCDGLSNYQEYLLGEEYTSFGFTDLSPRAAYSRGTKVPDYFLRYKTLYLGELFSDHDMIEDKWEDNMPSVISLGGTRVANFSRYVYDADWDAQRSGWDNWSMARAWFHESYVSNVVTEIDETTSITNEYLFSRIDDNNGYPMPEVPFRVVYRDRFGNHKNMAAHPHQLTVMAWSLENGNVDKQFGRPDIIWGGDLKGDGTFYEVSGHLPGLSNSKGALKPGRNMFVAYIAEGAFDEDTATPAYDPGMPYGVTIADVGPIGGADVNIELTDLDQSVVRMNMTASFLIHRGNGSVISAGSDEAKERFDQITQVYTDRGHYDPTMLRMPDYIGEDTELAVSNIHVRVLRAGINGLEKSPDGKTVLSSTKVLMDRYFKIGINDIMSEADLLADLPAGEGDLDWGGLTVADSKFGGKDKVTNAVYRIVIGDGTIKGTVENNNLIVMFINKFEASATQTPVANMEMRTFAGRPTFSWTHANSIDKAYPAFRLRVWDGATAIYDSGVQRAPVRDQAGFYNWAPPLWVGQMLLSNNSVFKGNKTYQWSVSMLDAKFTDPLENEEKKGFKMQETSPDPNAGDYGLIKLIVKYMGPGTVSTTTAANCIRVEAFTTADFTGEPVGVSYVTDDTNLQTEDTLVVNATIAGLPVRDEDGEVKYYVRAFLDTDVLSAEGGYGKRAPWESWGYVSYRSPKSGRYDTFTARAITATNNAKDEDAYELYIEDTDTNRNMVPDILEKKESGSSNSMLSPYIAFTASTLAKTNALESATVGTNGNASTLRTTRMLLAYANAVEALESGTISAGELAVLNGGVSLDTTDSAHIKITSFSLTEGISLEVIVDGTFEQAIAVGLDTGIINVTVEYSETLDNGGNWQREGDPVAISFKLASGVTTIEAEELGQITDAIESAKEKCVGGCYFRVSAVAFEN